MAAIVDRPKKRIKEHGKSTAGVKYEDETYQGYN